MDRILVTGVAGLVGQKTAETLLEQGKKVIGIDNLNDYYDVRLKKYRLGRLTKFKKFVFYRLDIEDLKALGRVFKRHRFDAVINLAARAGVRYSLKDPFVYQQTNALGTLNLLELAKRHAVKKFILASTSSLYAGQKMPFCEDLPVNTPISPYAATKKQAEVMAYVYHYLYKIDVTVLRYFTVYGPAGRPDMSPYRFIEWILRGKKIELFGDGSQSRDFTYVDDIAKGTVAALRPAGYEIINLGGSRSHSLEQMIRFIEKRTGKKAGIRKRPFAKADMRATRADIRKARKLLRWRPRVPFEQGLAKTVDWHLANRNLLGKVVF